jgi:outer membrane protein assembly factor BamB
LAETGEFSASAPALDSGVLLVGSDSGELLGIDAANGSELWRLAIPNKIDIDLNRASPPLVGGDRIYGVNDTGGFFALETGDLATERAA